MTRSRGTVALARPGGMREASESAAPCLQGCTACWITPQNSQELNKAGPAHAAGRPPLSPGVAPKPSQVDLRRKIHRPWAPPCALLASPVDPPGPSPGVFVPSLCPLSSSSVPSVPFSQLQRHRLGSPYATFTMKHNDILTIPFLPNRVLTTVPGTQKVTLGPPRGAPGLKIHDPGRPGAPPG